MFEFQVASNRSESIKRITKGLEPYRIYSHEESVKFNTNTLESIFQEYQKKLPSDILSKITYDPGSFNVKAMFYSSFSHADVWHLVGNLLFFYAFSMTVEIALGMMAYIFAFMVIGVGCNVFYSVLSFNDPTALPTLGLSGVVMGMMALKAYLAPGIRIKCFFWFIVLFKRFLIPAWLLAAWYIGWDGYYLFTDTDTGTANINFASHVGGALLGVLIGIIFFNQRRKELVSA